MSNPAEKRPHEFEEESLSYKRFRESEEESSDAIRRLFGQTRGGDHVRGKSWPRGSSRQRGRGRGNSSTSGRNDGDASTTDTPAATAQFQPPVQAAFDHTQWPTWKSFTRSYGPSGGNTTVNVSMGKPPSFVEKLHLKILEVASEDGTVIKHLNAVNRSNGANSNILSPVLGYAPGTYIGIADEKNNGVILQGLAMALSKCTLQRKAALFTLAPMAHRPKDKVYDSIFLRSCDDPEDERKITLNGTRQEDAATTGIQTDCDAGMDGSGEASSSVGSSQPALKLAEPTQELNAMKERIRELEERNSELEAQVKLVPFALKTLQEKMIALGLPGLQIPHPAVASCYSEHMSTLYYELVMCFLAYLPQVDKSSDEGSMRYLVDTFVSRTAELIGEFNSEIQKVILRNAPLSEDDNAPANPPAAQ